MYSFDHWKDQHLDTSSCAKNVCHIQSMTIANADSAAAVPMAYEVAELAL